MSTKKKGTAQGETWLTTAEAAQLLSIDKVVLRQMIGRHARHANGVTESLFDGITARKLGTRWRVRLNSWAGGGR